MYKICMNMLWYFRDQSHETGKGKFLAEDLMVYLPVISLISWKKAFFLSELMLQSTGTL